MTAAQPGVISCGDALLLQKDSHNGATVTQLCGSEC